MYGLLKEFYDVRSKVVHGSQLNARRRAMVEREDEMRDVVRRVLRCLLNLVESPFDPTRNFIDEKLDAILLEPSQRLALVDAGEPEVSRG